VARPPKRHDDPAFAHPAPFRRERINPYQSPPEPGSTIYYFQELLAA